MSRPSAVGRLGLALGILASATFVGCSNSSQSEPTGDAGTTTTAAGEPSPLELFGDALSSRLEPDGMIDKQLALDLYASVYGHATELGATPLAGANTEGTQALSAVLGHWDELTTAQQTVITADLAVAPARSVTVDPSAGNGEGSALVSRRRDDPMRTIVQNAANQIAIGWGSILPVSVQIDVMLDDLPTTEGHAPPWADARPATASGAVMTDPTTYGLCIVRVFPTMAGKPEMDIIAALAHETFHCFQFVGHTLAGLLGLGQWVVEGQAQWVGATVAGGGSLVTDWWRFWLAQPRPLWARTYDAFAIYASLDRRGEDVWSIFHRMLAGAPGFESMYATMAGSRGTAFLGDVSVDRAVIPDLGAVWMPAGPGVPTGLSGPLLDAAAPGDVVDLTFQVKAFNTAAEGLRVNDPVVIVSSDSAPWAVGVADDYQVQTAAGEVALCLRNECRCPDGQLVAARAVGDHSAVGIGVANATLLPITVQVHVTSLPLDDACARLARAAEAPVACLIGRWRLTEQVFGADFLPGIAAAGLSGGVGGRVLVIHSDGSYTMTDDGSDPTTGSSAIGGMVVVVLVVLTGQIDGTMSVVGDQATFQSTSAVVHLHLEETFPGSGLPPIVVDQDLNDTSVFGHGEAVVTCADSSLVLAFANATFRYALM
ncbi:MAG: hypothetical protein Q7V57_12680 [Actinomycetota bacterium]|nr:hypothetical protein [Actinomycetota bacterium]